MICWYQPREIMNSRQLVHLCSDNPRETYCGLEINSRWILWDSKDFHETTCKKCQKLKEKEEK